MTRHVAIRFGCAASPRWYDLSLTRLGEFIEALVLWGATSTELVLYPGEGDEATARVHVLERDWDAVVVRFQRRGIVCHAHAPLGPRFKVDRWAREQADFKAALGPVFRMLDRIARGQSVPPVLVFHAAGREATSEFVEWALEETVGSRARLAIELRRPLGTVPEFDSERESLANFVRSLGDERVGVCWDVAHDWEGGRYRPSWSPVPDDAFLRHVAHVHAHGEGRFEGHDDVHFPLQCGEVPWRAMLSPLVRRGYDGAMTVEARYRYARSVGDPWTMLGNGFAVLSAWLTEERMAIADPTAVRQPTTNLEQMHGDE